MKSLLIFSGLLGGFCAVANAATPQLLNTPEGDLVQRWNNAADQYEKAYILSGCKSTRTPSPGRSIYACQTADAKGIVSFVSVGVKLDRIIFLASRHAATDSSMFIRFVRASSSGNMGEVGIRLLTSAKASGRACVKEDAGTVCVNYVAGEYDFEVVKP